MSETILAFDFGTQSIGVAVGQLVTCSATPLTVLQARKGVPDWTEIDHLVEEWQPHAFVVGLPLNMDGTSQWITDYAQDFASALVSRYRIPVNEVDERLSTVAAKEILFNEGGAKALNKQEIDSFSAKLILETWLNNHNKSEG